MAHTQSALKRARQNVKDRSRNRAGKSSIKTLKAAFDKALAGKDAAVAKKAYSAFCSVLDKSAKRGMITRNTAIRKKGRAQAALRKAQLAA